MHTHINAVPTTQLSNDHQKFGELANFIDAIPAEIREEILLAAFQLHPYADFGACYFARFVRTLFHSCLAERTGNNESIASLHGVDLPTVRQGLSSLVAAEDPAQVASALNGLMDLLSFASAISAEKCLN